MTLFELLADHGIRLKRLTPGHTEHLDCPRCGGGAHRDKGSLSVTVDPDGQGATWVCHRGTCGWTSGVREHQASPRAGAQTRLHGPRLPAAGKPAMADRYAVLGRPDWLYEECERRHIGRATIAQFDVRGGKYYFGSDLGEQQAILFPYRWEGELLWVKLREREKRTFRQEKARPDAPPVLFNADSLHDASVCVWTEGEFDVMALHEAQVQHSLSGKFEVLEMGGGLAIVSLKDGAKAFAAFDTHAEALARIEHHVLAGDADQPGLEWRDELARRLGRHKCHLVRWPDDCKDPCDVMAKHGADVLLACFDSLEAWPVEGIDDFSLVWLEEVLKRGRKPTMTTGTPSLDDILKLPTDGRIIVVTGYSNHGKSSWTRHVAVHTAFQHDRKWVFFSAEDENDRAKIDCISLLTGKGFWTEMSDEERVEAVVKLQGKIKLIEGDPDGVRTLDWLLDTFAATVLANGVTDVVIDPFNEVDHDPGTKSQTEYIGDCLKQIRRFVRRHGVNVWLLAHPTKPFPGTKNEPPDGYDISGSAHWNNKADLGITVHMTAERQSQISIWKSRVPKQWGLRGAKRVLDFDQRNGRYIDLVQPDQPPPRPRRDIDD